MMISTDLLLALTLEIPASAALVLALIPNAQWAGRLNAAASFLAFLCSLGLVFQPMIVGAYLFTDALNLYFLVLSTFIGLTTSLFSIRYIAVEIAGGLFKPVHIRLYHAAFQLLLFSMSLSLLANNIGVMWVALELATLANVLMVGLYRSDSALEAAWKYFILGSVGIALALFGVILVYVAAQPVLGEGASAMVWTVLVANGARFSASLLNVAFVFLILGYGTKMALVPMHAWMPDAHSEGPTPITAILSGLLLNAALYVVLRFKTLLATNVTTLRPGPVLMGLGLLSLIFAAFMLYRRRDIKRLYSYSSLEHMGVLAFAFGLGGPLANFAGLLHVAMHSLTKSAIFFSVGQITQIKNSQKISDISGLTINHPWLGWSLVAGVIAIAGLPPFGVFASEFLILSASFAQTPVLAAALAVGLLIAFGALTLSLNAIAFGEPSPDHAGYDRRFPLSLAPIVVHLALVLMAALYLPPTLVAWMRQAALMLDV